MTVDISCHMMSDSRSVEVLFALTGSSSHIPKRNEFLPTLWDPFNWRYRGMSHSGSKKASGGHI